jgi:hypothetical protein
MIDFDNWLSIGSNFTIGDKVKPITQMVEKTSKFNIIDDYKRGLINDSYDYIVYSKYNYNVKIIEIQYTNEGEEVFRLNKQWPFYKSKYFKKII